MHSVKKVSSFRPENFSLRNQLTVALPVRLLLSCECVCVGSMLCVCVCVCQCVRSEMGWMYACVTHKPVCVQPAIVFLYEPASDWLIFKDYFRRNSDLRRREKAECPDKPAVFETEKYTSTE